MSSIARRGREGGAEVREVGEAGEGQGVSLLFWRGCATFCSSTRYFWRFRVLR